MQTRESSRALFLRGGACAAALLLLTGAPRATAEPETSTGQPAELDWSRVKGGARAGDPPAFPRQKLSLAPPPPPPPAPVAAAAPPPPEPERKVCGPALAAAPLRIGDKQRFAKLGGLVKGAALGALGKALSGATGGMVNVAGKKKNEPDMYEDPVEKAARQELEFEDLDTELRMGAKLASDGLVLSTRLDDAPDKGTVHAVYLESDDCERLFPFALWTYELWGEWSLSVSWTRTTETYQDGKLIDRDVTSGGYTDAGRELLASDSGEFDLATGQGKLPPGMSRDDLARYQSELSRGLGKPVWAALGFGAPTSGARGIGTPFRVSPEQMEGILAGKWSAVVHVTRDAGDRFETVGLPMRMSVGEGGKVLFKSLR
jgi:hypothetical protein